MKNIFNLLSNTAKLLLIPVKYGIQCLGTTRFQWYSGLPDPAMVQLPRVNIQQNKGINKRQTSRKKRVNKNTYIKSRRKNKDFPGIYVVKYSNDSIKIGRSKHVLQRLKSYKGYQSHGQDIEYLLLIETEDHKIVERKIHEFAVTSGLERVGQLEIFKCIDQPSFCKKLIKFITTLGAIKYPPEVQLTISDQIIPEKRLIQLNTNVKYDKKGDDDNWFVF